MEKESVNSIRDLIKSLKKNMERLKESMKNGDEEDFKKIKSESLNLSKKIEELIND